MIFGGELWKWLLIKTTSKAFGLPKIDAALLLFCFEIHSFDKAENQKRIFITFIGVDSYNTGNLYNPACELISHSILFVIFIIIANVLINVFMLYDICHNCDLCNIPFVLLLLYEQ